MYYNVYLNKSGDWGVMPPLWYFYSALPRALLSSLLLLPAAPLLDKRSLLLLLPTLSFIAIYSILPHKELRFIIYSIPLLNTAAAMTASGIWRKRNTSFLLRLLGVGLLGHLFLNFVLSLALARVSSLNYPGGEAIKTLHSLKDSTSPVNVHLDVFTCQTGVSRFLQERLFFLNSCVKTGCSSSSDMTGATPKPRISPLKSCPASPTFWLRVPIDTRFSYGHSWRHMIFWERLRLTLGLRFSKSSKFVTNYHQKRSQAFIFPLQVQYNTFPPVTVKTRPAIYILERKSHPQ